MIIIAVVFTKKYYSDDEVGKARKHYADLRSGLQSAGAKSTKRHLKKLSGKESGFARINNYTISKEIARKAGGVSSAIAIEDINGIRMRTTVRKGNRYIHNSWAFRQLRMFVEYKAKEAGISIVVIEPHNTSRECLACHTIDKRNRIERSHFKCVSCGLEGEADFIASLNIRNRAAVNQPIVTGAIFDHVDSPVVSPRASAAGS